MKKTWIIIGIIIGIISAGSFLLTAFLLEGLTEWVLIIIAFVGLSLHQAGNYLILYQFAISKQRMSNRLHVYNKLLIMVMSICGIIYGIMLKLMTQGLSENPSGLISLIFIVLMILNIIYQENNTTKFIKKPLIKIKYNQRRSFNQYFGVLSAALAIMMIWINLVSQVKIDAAIYLFLFLYLVQTGLSYTTYGQSRYWNFTYEVLMSVYVLSIGFNRENFIIIMLGIVLCILLSLRQWKEREYKSYSIIFGVGLYLGVILLAWFTEIFVNKYFSGTLFFSLVILMISYILTFLVNDPKFHKRFFKS